MTTLDTQTDQLETLLPEEHVVVFRLADEFYAIDIQVVQEIVRLQAITAIPGAESWVEGLTNLRGRVVPVIDLRRRCGVELAEATPETRIVVVGSKQGLVGLMVDAVTEVIRIPGEQVEDKGTIVHGPASDYLRGIAKLENRLVSLMDLEAVLPSPRMAAEAVAEHRAAAA